MAGQLVLDRQAPGRAGPGLHRRCQRRGHPGLDRLPGRLVDGPGLPGRVRAPGQRVVRLAAAVRAVHRPVSAVAPDAGADRRTPAARLVARPPGSARAARLLGLARLLQPREDRDLDPDHLPVHAVPAGPHAAARVRTRASARAVAPVRAGHVAGHRDDLPGRVPGRAERRQLQRDRRRVRRRDRGRQAASREGSVRRLAEGQRERRHLRPGRLLRLRPVPRDLRLERHVGRPARRPRCRDRV